MDCRPARMMRKSSGVHSQTSTTTRPRKAVTGWASTCGASEAQRLEQGIDDADVRGVEQAPDDADDDGRDRHRQDQHDADEAGIAQLARHEKRQQQAEQGLDRDDEHDEHRRGQDRLPEDGVAVDDGEIVPARKAHVAPVAEAVQARLDAVQGRVERRRRREPEPRAGAGDRARRPHAAAAPCSRVPRRSWPRRFWRRGSRPRNNLPAASGRRWSGPRPPRDASARSRRSSTLPRWPPRAPG